MTDRGLPPPQAPRRLQLSRAAGFRLPAGTASVAHPTCWANPYRPAARNSEANAVAVRHFIAYLTRNPELVERARQTLGGLDLACWCRLTLPCHADVWLLVVGSLRELDPATALQTIVASATGVHSVHT